MSQVELERGLFRFNIFVHYLDTEIKGMVVNFVDNTKLEGIVNIFRSWIKIKRDLAKMEN